jgi:PD-(D/E)XK nuclease superfamily protein
VTIWSRVKRVFHFPPKDAFGHSLHFASAGSTIHVKCYSHSLTNGRVRATKHYTAQTVDWIAVWDASTATPYYIPSNVFDGHSVLTLRLAPTRNGQLLRTRQATDFLEI